MHIVILCATDRGIQFAQHVFKIGAGHDFTVFSFPETPWEPKYFDDLRQLVDGHGHRFHQARNVAHPKWKAFWSDPVDLLLMVSWRYLVPSSIYRRARLGAYVFHDSLLPKYRGFAPTVWAMINGESETGVTLFEVTDEVDAGDIVDQRAVAIGFTDRIADVVGRVTGTYLQVIEDNWRCLLSGNAQLRPQNHAEATYTCKWTPADAHVDWRKSSKAIYNLVRATSHPYPGAYTSVDGRKLTVWSAELPRETRRYVSSAPGRIARIEPGRGATVLTGDGSILLKDVQLENEPMTNAAAILNSPSLTLTRGQL